MPANQPVLWTIQSSLVTALGNISAGSTYFFTAASVENRDNDEQPNSGEGDFVVGLDSIAEADAETFGKRYWFATFIVSATVAPVSGVSNDQLRARLWSDIQTAVMADPQRTVSSVKYAIDTRVLAPEIVSAHGNRIGMDCPVQVHFRHAIDDPTSL